MLKVGITGNMGAGKSLVAEVFQTLRIPFFGADEQAIWLTENNPQVKSEITSLFGRQAYTSEGKYNRKFIAEQIFTNPRLLEQLNAIIHPAVFQRFFDWADEQDAPYVMKEAAILFESGADKTCDKIVFVSAPEEIRTDRVKKRNPAWSEADIKRRMQTQQPEEAKILKSDYVINNDGEQFLLPQILDIHKRLLEEANRH
ncbi:MAG TPA: dephospho-CoA kinase [Chitinophagales bacterium]|nr:dephospho-CoA kinase [Chitinophagales bacterium]